MKVELRDDEGIKKIETVLLLVAVALLPLGVVGLQGAMDTGDTTKYMMSIGLIVVGALCGALYLYVEKAIPKTDEEKKEEVKTEEEKPKEEEKKEEVKTEEPKVEEKKESPKE